MSSWNRKSSGEVMKELVDNPTKGKLLAKKKTKQLKLKAAFVERNFQKYPIKNCVYDPVLKKHVHQPGRYAKEFSKLELASACCCSSCYLRPCIMVGKQITFIEGFKYDYEDPDFALRNAETQAIILFQKFCGKLWMDRMKIKPGSPASLPLCVKGALPRLLRQAVAEATGTLVVPHEEVSSSDEFELTDSEAS